MLLSICVPTWNRNLELGRLVYSVVSQMTEELCEKVELVISDNGSDIDPLPMIEEIVQSNPLVRVLYNRNERNTGAIENMKTVLSMANGEYCWVFGNDDCMYPNTLNNVISKIEVYRDVDLVSVVFDNINIERNQCMRLFHTRCHEEKIYQVRDYDDFCEYFFSEADYAGGNQGLFCFISSVIFKKKNWYMYCVEKYVNVDSIYLPASIHLNTFLNGGKHLALVTPTLARDCKEDANVIVKPEYLCSVVRDMYELLYRFFNDDLALELARLLIPRQKELIQILRNAQIDEERKNEVFAIWERIC